MSIILSGLAAKYGFKIEIYSPPGFISYWYFSWYCFEATPSHCLPCLMATTLSSLGLNKDASNFNLSLKSLALWIVSKLLVIILFFLPSFHILISLWSLVFSSALAASSADIERVKVDLSLPCSPLFNQRWSKAETLKIHCALIACRTNCFGLYTIYFLISQWGNGHLLNSGISLLLNVYLLQVKVYHLRCTSSTLANTPHCSGIELCTGARPSHTCTLLQNLSYSHI